MTDAVIQVQQALVAALSAHPVLWDSLTGIYDGPPPRAAYPYITIADNLATDWSTKDWLGREIRVGVNIWDDGDSPARLHELSAHVEDALAALPDMLGGWQMASNQFLRSLIARDADGPWLALVEQRIRMMRDV